MQKGGMPCRDFVFRISIGKGIKLQSNHCDENCDRPFKSPDKRPIGMQSLALRLQAGLRIAVLTFKTRFDQFFDSFISLSI